MTFPSHRTKIVCTIGPSCSAPEVLARLQRAGMGVARLNFAHGDRSSMSRRVADIRELSRQSGRRITLLADLAGPKIRVGELQQGSVLLEDGGSVTLVEADADLRPNAVPLSASGIVGRLEIGDTVYMNDGFIRLRVEAVSADRADCRVESGGRLFSGKGLNVPGRDLGLGALTESDSEWIGFAAEKGIDALSVSFVRSADDVSQVRRLAASQGYHPFLIAKIERASALQNLESILEAADGLMVARGDLGVETEIEEIALVQKRLIRRARSVGKPVITATQMLESMVSNPRPTRAEATDVANAILDGTDCLMLSEESAVGQYPVEAVRTMARIAALTERTMAAEPGFADTIRWEQGPKSDVRDLVVNSIRTIVEARAPVAVVTPTSGGTTPRRISRYRLPVWVVAACTDSSICQVLNLSWGIYPVEVGKRPPGWEEFAADWLRKRGIDSGLVVLAEGSSSDDADAINRMEVIRLD